MVAGKNKFHQTFAQKIANFQKDHRKKANLVKGLPKDK